MSAYDWDPLVSHQQHQQQRFIISPQPPEVKGGKRSRQTYSKYQTAVLETVFQTSKYIVRNKRQQMSAELRLTERQIKIWFQNRRMKEKKCHKETPHPHHPPPNQPPPHRPHHLHAVGYAAAADDDDDGYSGNNNIVLDECGGFANHYHGPVSCKSDHDDHGYAGYGPMTEVAVAADPFAAAKQPLLLQWPPAVAVDHHHHHHNHHHDEFHLQDLYGDHDSSDHFQRLPANAHHHIINSQVPPDYCPPQQLQAAHGY